jgi:hypothetical protein
LCLIVPSINDLEPSPKADFCPGGHLRDARSCFTSYFRLYPYLDNSRDESMPQVSKAPQASGQGRESLDAARFASANRKRLSAPALRTFLTIADLWGLNEEERRLILGYPSRSTFHNWARIAREHGEITLDVDVLTRISAVLGIHQALGILHETEHDGIAWLRRPHGAIPFGGNPPMALVTAGTQDALMTVRRFLDGARGGLYMPPNEIDRGFVPYEDADILFT